MKGIPERMIEGLADTTAHQILGQSVVFPAFEAVAQELGKSLWRWRQFKQVVVEVLDTEQDFIGGDDFHWATALVDGEGYIKLTPASEIVGMPINFNLFENEESSNIAFFDPEGKEISSAHEPCRYVPAELTADGKLRVSAEMIN